MYTEVKISEHLTDAQIALAGKISSLLSSQGFKTHTLYDHTTIDVVVEVGGDNPTSLSEGIFRIFWSSIPQQESSYYLGMAHSEGNPLIGYLGAGEPYFDGYEVSGVKWVRGIPLPDVIRVAQENKESLYKFRNRFK